MAKVTYLFGAGASAEALPVVAKMGQRIADMKNRLKISDLAIFGKHIPSDQDYNIVKQTLVLKLTQLEDKLTRHASIDSYAKKLYVSQDYTELAILKIIIAYFFIYEQQVRPEDRRYDAFFASILGSYSQDFSDLRVLSWNYDYQFELAYREYINETSLIRIQQTLPVIPWREFKFDVGERFCICKLNGTTAFKVKNGDSFWNQTDNLDQCSEIIILRDFVDSYWRELNTIDSPKSLISFAWEKNPNSDVMNEAIRGLDKTEAFVIIGYSFPFFNRQIDRIIFKNLNPEAIIYVQDREPTNVINNLKSTLGANANSYHIEPVKVTEPEDKSVVQFYLPSEL